MRDKVILVCSECLARNYTTTKKHGVATSRIQIIKFCPRCNKHTLHKESK